jgi:hypothetical protein
VKVKNAKLRAARYFALRDGGRWRIPYFWFPFPLGKGLGVRLPRSLHEDCAEVVVGYFAGVAQREVRCDEAAGVQQRGTIAGRAR